MNLLNVLYTSYERLVYVQFRPYYHLFMSTVMSAICSSKYEMRFATFYHLCNLKYVKNTRGGVKVALLRECFLYTRTWLEHD